MGISGQMWLPNLDTILECDQNFEKGSNGGHGALTPSVFSESRPQSIISENSILELSDSEDETLIRIENIKISQKKQAQNYFFFNCEEFASKILI